MLARQQTARLQPSQHGSGSASRMSALVVPQHQHCQEGRARNVIRPASSLALQEAPASSPISTAASSLATYTLRSSSAITTSRKAACWSQMWFEAMVQTVVKQLDGEPFLLRVSMQQSLQLSLIRLSSSDVAQGWGYIQQQYLQPSAASGAAADYDAVILVHPVASEQQPCIISQVQGQACHGCPHTQPGSSSSSTAAAAGSSYSSYDQEALMQGKFGDCCSGDGSSSSASHESHQHHEHHHQQQHYSSSQQQQQSKGTSRSRSDSELSYYGLVVQCKDTADPLQGCYLLKTMQIKQHSGGGSGCHCTHYSLNRVCQGPSLQQQFQAAWLV